MKLTDQIQAAERLDARIKRLNDHVAKLERQSKEAWHEIWLTMDDLGFQPGDSVTVNGTKYGKETTWYPAFQDTRVFVDWAAEHDPELIQPKLRKQLVNQRVQQMMDDGKELPPGLGAWPKEWVSRRQK